MRYAIDRRLWIAGAPRADVAQAARMPEPTKNAPTAGGFLIAVGAIGGTIVGIALRQTTLGFLIGTATGIACAIAIWLVGRRA